MLTAAVDRLPTKPDESRVTLRGMDWFAYQQMRQLLMERSQARLTYDQGTLEITMSSF
jgi:hypothetical protein